MKLKHFIAATLGLTAALAAQPAEAAQAGPDGFAHIISDAADPALFDTLFTDITGTGTLLTSGDDESATHTFPAGSTFWMYGAEQTQFQVSTNGYLSTDLTDAGDDYTNDCDIVLPSEGGGDRIYAMHADLDTDVYVQYFAGSNATVIEWIGGYHGVAGSAVDFEVIFYHDLDVALLLVNDNDDLGAVIDGVTVGMQNAAADNGVQFSCVAVGPQSIVGYGTLHINEVRRDQVGADNDEYFELTGVPGFDLDEFTLFTLGDTAADNGGRVEAIVSLAGTSFDPGGQGFTREVFAESSFTLLAPGDFWSMGTALAFENDDNVTFVLVQDFTGTANQDLDTDNDSLIDVAPFSLAIDSMSILENQTGQNDLVYSGNTAGPDGTNDVGHAHRCPDLHGGFTLGFFDIADGDDSPLGLNACPVCGDSALQFGEDCDEGAANTVTCDDDCTAVLCGDGLTNDVAGEECDDDNAIQGDDCLDTCVLNICGDGWVDMQGGVTEACDGDGAGNPAETATCDTDCTAAACGDTVVNNTAGETCDEATLPSATCDASCTDVDCGDGRVNAAAGEQCDTSGETVTCDDDCTNVMCGDMTVNTAAGEDCDEGSSDTATCDDDCTDATCGDSHTNTVAGEECDDGNTNNGDGCDSTCMDEGAGGGGPGGNGGEGGNGGMGNMGNGGMGNTGNNGGMGPGGSGSGNDDEETDGDTNAEGGCDCSMPGQNGSGNNGSALAPWLMLAGIGVVIRRRRRAA